MVDRDLLAAKLADLADRRERVRAHLPSDADALRADRDALSAATAEALRNAVGFRNAVAHGYSGLDVDMAYRAATTGLADLSAFAREVSVWASRGS